MAITALIVVDLQNDFLSYGGSCSFPYLKQNSIPRMLEKVKSAINRARKNNVPIFWIRSEYTGKKKDKITLVSEDYECTIPCNSEFHSGTHSGTKQVCHPGSWGTEFPDDVKVMMQKSDTIVTKDRYSAFTDTNIQELIPDTVEHLVIMGVSTNVCVLANACDAKISGYRVSVPEDTTMSGRVSGWKQGLAKIEAYYGSISSIDSVKIE